MAAAAVGVAVEEAVAAAVASFVLSRVLSDILAKGRFNAEFHTPHRFEDGRWGHP